MRQPFQSESHQQVGAPAQQLSGIPPSCTRPADTATLELLRRWQQEDATIDPAQLNAAEEELVEFMEAINDARTTSGEPLLYP